MTVDCREDPKDRKPVIAIILLEAVQVFLSVCPVALTQKWQQLAARKLTAAAIAGPCFNIQLSKL